MAHHTANCVDTAFAESDTRVSARPIQASGVGPTIVVEMAAVLALFRLLNSPQRIRYIRIYAYLAKWAVCVAPATGHTDAVVSGRRRIA